MGRLPRYRVRKRLTCSAAAGNCTHFDIMRIDLLDRGPGEVRVLPGVLVHAEEGHSKDILLLDQLLQVSAASPQTSTGVIRITSPNWPSDLEH